MREMNINSTKRVLIVDDDSIDREMVKRYLSKCEQKFEISEASSVDEGLALFDEQSFDVILLDYRMPQKDGIEMILELKTHTRGYGSAIIMMSSAKDEELITASLEAGAQDFIPKSELNDRQIIRAITNAQTRFKLEQELRSSYLRSKELAEKDSLTGLANRFVFEESLQVAVANNVRSEFRLGLLLIDIENFKGINDVYGIDIGDNLLKKFVSRLQAILRGDELFSRLSSDEFSILIANLRDSMQLGDIANRIIKCLETPFRIKDFQINLNANIGMAIHPDNTTDCKELLKCSHIAMHRAKLEKGSSARFFYKEMQTEFLRRHSIEEAISAGIEKNRFSLFYQAIVHPSTGKLSGFEALCRLKDENNQYISPEEFIPMSEQSGVIFEIGEWVIKQAVRQLKRWQESVSSQITMSINLSAVQLGSKTIISYLEALIEEYNLEPSDIEFEITETAFLNINELTLSVVREIKSLGFRLALDDFGTGYSSISHLLLLPIDTVKIDKSLMPEDSDANESIKLLNAMFTLVNSLGLEIIVEGIEQPFHKELVTADKNIVKVQGYLFHRPAPASELDLNILLK